MEGMEASAVEIGARGSVNALHGNLRRQRELLAATVEAAQILEGVLGRVFEQARPTAPETGTPGLAEDGRDGSDVQGAGAVLAPERLPVARQGESPRRRRRLFREREGPPSEWTVVVDNGFAAFASGPLEDVAGGLPATRIAAQACVEAQRRAGAEQAQWDTPDVAR